MTLVPLENEMHAIKLTRIVEQDQAPKPVLVNWSLIKEIIPIDDSHVNVNFTDGTTITYANSLADVEGAIRKAWQSKQGVAKVRKARVPKKCPLCGESLVICPSCGKRGMCECDLQCCVCSYITDSFNEIDAAQKVDKP